MFIQNKYKNIYFSLIEKAKNRILEEYTEKHHIIPRSLGGSNEPKNIVELTAREHFISHLLLVKFTNGAEKSKMVKAAYSMINWNKQKVNSKIYESLKKLHSHNMKVDNPVYNEEVRKKISVKLKGRSNPFKGKTRTEEARKRMSEGSKGRVPWNKGLVGAQSSTRKGVPRSEETKIKIKNSVMRTLQMKAQHCV